MEPAKASITIIIPHTWNLEITLNIKHRQVANFPNCLCYLHNCQKSCSLRGREVCAGTFPSNQIWIITWWKKNMRVKGGLFLLESVIITTYALASMQNNVALCLLVLNGKHCHIATHV